MPRRTVLLAAAGLMAVVAPLALGQQPASATTYTATTVGELTLHDFNGNTFTCHVEDDASHDTDTHTATVTGYSPDCDGAGPSLSVEVSAKDENGQVVTATASNEDNASVTLQHAVSAVNTTVTIAFAFPCESGCTMTVNAAPK